MNDPLKEIKLRRRSGQRVRLGIPAAWATLPLRLLAGFKGVLAALIVLGGLYLALTNHGAPAIHYSYDYRMMFGGERFKTKCRYLSPNGMHQRAARNGRCAWIVMTRKGSR